ncbi:MAG: MSMEG_0570 family nitrogen starvation response protein [Planctomycetota bacterium]
MPSVLLELRWPDETVTVHTSPSTIIQEYFQVDQSLPLDDFLAQAEAGFNHANERVKEKFGFFCSQATGELAELRRLVATQDEGSVDVVSLKILR